MELCKLTFSPKLKRKKIFLKSKASYVYYLSLFIWRDKKKAKSINYSVNAMLLIP